MTLEKRLPLRRAEWVSGRPLSRRYRGPYVRMHKVVALVEHGFALVAGEGVAEAVAEVQLGRVAAALAVVAIGVARDAGLIDGDGFNLYAESLDDLIDFPAESC